MIRPDLVAALAQSVMPEGIAVAATDPRVMPDLTDVAEGAAVRGAVPKRMTEFHAGRAAAHAAMQALGLPSRPVPMAADRAPIWPEGLTGSIAHCAQACVAAVGLGADWAGIGVDIEDTAPLDPALIPEICTQAEQAWLARQPAAEQGLMAKLVFCAKEAVYKAQYPLSGALFGFDALEISVNRAHSSFEARFVQGQGPFARGAVLRGSYAHAAGLLVTAVAFGQSGVELRAGDDLPQA